MAEPRQRRTPPARPPGATAPEDRRAGCPLETEAFDAAATAELAAAQLEEEAAALRALLTPADGLSAAGRRSVVTLRGVERLAEGRMAEVFAFGDDRVLKLDRPEWSGVAPVECELLERLDAAGLPVARPHGTVTVDGRTGLVLERVHGAPVREELLAATADDVVVLAERFAALHWAINRTAVEGLPALVPRLRSELGLVALAPAVAAELTALLGALDDGTGGVCHFDFHPENVLSGQHGWVVVDWLAVASGPAAADLARTLVLWGRSSVEPVPAFLRAVRRLGRQHRGIDDEALDAWVRVVAGARLAEGLGGADDVWLREVAAGSLLLAH